MEPLYVYEAVAKGVAAQGVEMVYAVMGDGNMPWLSSFRKDLGKEVIHARHESGAVSMADGHARVSGGVGVCSTTQGPGLTNAITALSVASAHRTPLVLLTGELPLQRTKDKSGQIYQRADQAGLVRSVGGDYRQVTAPSNVLADLTWAFSRAQRLRRPVVLGVPVDVMRCEVPAGWREPTSVDEIHRRVRPEVPREAVQELAEILARASRPIIIAGRGVWQAAASEYVAELGSAFGAGLATTIRAKGLFEGHRNYLGIAGGYASAHLRPIFSEADVLLVMGSSLSAHTLDWGELAPKATIVHVNLEDASGDISVMTPHVFVRADVREICQSLIGVAEERHLGPKTHWWVPDESYQSNQGQSPSPPSREGATSVHPESAIEIIDHQLPKDWRIVIGIGHFWWYPLHHLTGRDPDRYIFAYDFGCIGQTLPIALGACVGDSRERPVAVIEGDVGLMMNVQELETVVRAQVPMMVIVMNDGASGAEVHRMRAEDFDFEQVQFGRPNFAAVAEAVGGQGWQVTTEDQLADALSEAKAVPYGLNLIDVHIDSSVASPIILKYLEHSS